MIEDQDHKLNKNIVGLVIFTVILVLGILAYLIPLEVDIETFAEPTSGVRGIVTIGPTCPVVFEGWDDSQKDKCADRQFGAELEVFNDKNKSIVILKAQENDGSFVVPLKPGNYIIKKRDSVAQLPSLTPVSFTVSEGEYINISLQMDSGIR